MNIGVIGAGTMGSGIAQVASTADCQVYLYDSQVAALERSKQQLAKIMDRLVTKGRLTEEKAQQIQQNIHYVQDLNELANAELVIEAIIENPDIKKQVFQRLEPLLSTEAIIASNTSSLSIASLAAACQRPERFIGIHFFNPAPLMKLVEIIPAVQTANAILDKANDIIASWGKQTVIAKDTPGFIVNRVARPFYGEALRIYDEGIADIPTIDWAMKNIGQFRMGPFELMDFIGNDVNYTVTETVFKAFYYDPRYRPSFTQKRMSEAGYLGRKSGRGYYDYQEGVIKPSPTEDTALGQTIVDRIVAMLINEAADALHFRIATREDIDAAMTKGVNYPKGLLSWADEIGIEACVQRLDQLFDHYRESRYRCSPLLRKMAANGERFFSSEKAPHHV
ncbi:MAG: 3-hydroxybutyryl-CoA dehydrogenase [Saprospiraceae bacterium]|nr:3-hydroxybutyryl-CoA dehydrogenase [Saprospiraceae bacterium]